MRILFVDDEPHNVDLAGRVLREVLGAQIEVAPDVGQAIDALHRGPVDLLVTDVFVPLGGAREFMGPRARRATEGGEHLGGLVLLDEVDRMVHPPRVLIHTACTDFALVALLREHQGHRVPKPASPDVLLRAVMEALELPVPG